MSIFVWTIKVTSKRQSEHVAFILCKTCLIAPIRVSTMVYTLPLLLCWWAGSLSLWEAFLANDSCKPVSSPSLISCVPLHCLPCYYPRSFLGSLSLSPPPHNIRKGIHLWLSLERNKLLCFLSLFVVEFDYSSPFRFVIIFFFTSVSSYFLILALFMVFITLITKLGNSE